MIGNPRQARMFAALRRDRMLFAVVGALILALHLLQPLAAARAAANGIDVICSALGVENLSGADQIPAGVDNCPQCVAGPCAGFATVERLLEGSVPAHEHAALAVEARQIPAPIVSGERHASDPPPFLRGPPLSA